MGPPWRTPRRAEAQTPGPSRAICVKRVARSLLRATGFVVATRLSASRFLERLFRGRGGRLADRHQQALAQQLVDLVRHCRVVAQVLAHVLLALTDAVALVAVPGAGFVDQVLRHDQFDDLAFTRGALAVQDLEFALAERRGHLVLDYLDAGFRTDDLLALLYRADATDVQAHRGVEFQRVAAGGGLRAAEHYADLHADLIDEDHQRAGLLDVGGELAQR